MSKKILIIEDDADVRLGLNARLRASGYQTALAADAMTAVHAARREQPDLILLDIGLPGGDGYLVLERLHAIPQLSCIPVVVVSARPAHTHAAKALEAGASAFLQKPVDNDVLLRTIHDALGGEPAAAEIPSAGAERDDIR
jgi:two-component system KDP operon response regulator KdpE